MLERHILAVKTESPGLEEPAATRERLKGKFTPGAARRMTQLGMLIGSVLAELEPSGEDALMYASEYGESRALEAFLESFPAPSPTLFQTSIHPSGVQQGLIGRQRGVPELFPFAGGGTIVGQHLLAAVLSPKARVLVCGGEERGTWLRELGIASEKTFAYAAALGREPGPAPLGRIVLRQSDEVSLPLSLVQWFDLLAERRTYDGPLLPGWRLQVTWNAS